MREILGEAGIKGSKSAFVHVSRHFRACVNAPLRVACEMSLFD
jgi:hypothetical protein